MKKFCILSLIICSFTIHLHGVSAQSSSAAPPKDLSKQLAHAIIHRRLSKTRSLLEQGASTANLCLCDLIDGIHYTDEEKIIHLLIDNGVSVDKADRWGKSPLEKAFKHCNYYAARLLINNGAKIGEKEIELARRSEQKDSPFKNVACERLRELGHLK